MIPKSFNFIHIVIIVVVVTFKVSNQDHSLTNVELAKLALGIGVWIEEFCSFSYAFDMYMYVQCYWQIQNHIDILEVLALKGPFTGTQCMKLL